MSQLQPMPRVTRSLSPMQPSVAKTKGQILVGAPIKLLPAVYRNEVKNTSKLAHLISLQLHTCRQRASGVLGWLYTYAYTDIHVCVPRDNAMIDLASIYISIYTSAEANHAYYATNRAWAWVREIFHLHLHLHFS